MHLRNDITELVNWYLYKISSSYCLRPWRAFPPTINILSNTECKKLHKLTKNWPFDASSTTKSRDGTCLAMNPINWMSSNLFYLEIWSSRGMKNWKRSPSGSSSKCRAYMSYRTSTIKVWRRDSSLAWNLISSTRRDTKLRVSSDWNCSVILKNYLITSWVKSLSMLRFTVYALTKAVLLKLT